MICELVGLCITNQFNSFEIWEQLFDYIDSQSSSNKGGRLTGEAIRVYVADQFQINYHPNAIYKLLHLLDFSWITSRFKHPKQSQAAQDQFTETANGNDQVDPRAYRAG